MASSLFPTRSGGLNPNFNASSSNDDDDGRERLKRHRSEVAGKVAVPEKWSQEEMLKDWLDFGSFDALLAPKGFDIARAALIAERRQWIPEASLAMALQGGEILLDSRDHWKRVMQGHAGASLVPLVASNRLGKEVIQTEHGDSKITFFGNSFIAGPTGEIVACADDKMETVITAEFDLNKIKSKRHSLGVFRDRRPELYKVLLTLDGTSK